MKMNPKKFSPEKSSAVQASKKRPLHPPGFEPGMEFTDSGTGFIVPAPRPRRDGELIDARVAGEAEPWDEHLIRAGIDPDSVDLIFPVEIRVWPGYVKNEILIAQAKKAIENDEYFEYEESDLIVEKDMVYFKAKMVPKGTSSQAIADAEFERIKSFKPRKPAVPKGERTLVVPWGDWQIGKDDGDGVQGTIDRVLNSFEQTVDFAKKIKPSRILIASIGDMIESCDGQYAQQTFRVEMNLRDQEHTARRLVVEGIKTLSDYAPVVEVLPVGGNHGENRKDGKSFTDFADNFDVSIFEAVKDQLGENPDRFGHVVFRIPREDLTQTIDLHGHILGILHGHQARRGGATTEAKIDKWLEGQLKARRPIGDADIIVNGHYHRFLFRTVGPRWHIQIPAMDGGSQWWDQVAGGGDPAGQVVFTIDENGLDNLRVFPAARLPRDE